MLTSDEIRSLKRVLMRTEAALLRLEPLSPDHPEVVRLVRYRRRLTDLLGRIGELALA